MNGEKIYPDHSLKAQALACQRGGREVFTNLSFGINSGQILVLSGPNGSGKSTLLRLVAGLLEASSGRIYLDDQNFEAKGNVHYLGHLPALKASETVRESLEFWQEFQGGEGDIVASLKVMGLENLIDLPIKYLSEGQRRRVSFSRTLLTDLPIWLLDEPNAGLDKKSLSILNECELLSSKFRISSFFSPSN